MSVKSSKYVVDEPTREGLNVSNKEGSTSLQESIPRAMQLQACYCHITLQACNCLLILCASFHIAVAKLLMVSTHFT